MEPGQRGGGDSTDEPVSVPGVGGPGSLETSPDGQSALKLHAGISVVGAVLSAFVTLVFFLLLDAPAPGFAFAVVTVATLGWLGWALIHLRRGRRLARRRDRRGR